MNRNPPIIKDVLCDRNWRIISKPMVLRGGFIEYRGLHIKYCLDADRITLEALTEKIKQDIDYWMDIMGVVYEGSHISHVEQSGYEYGYGSMIDWVQTAS